MKHLFILILGTITLGASAQFKCGEAIDIEKIAFRAGEELNYNVKYSAAIISTSVADVHFRTVTDKNAFKITALGKTRPFYSNFFDMEDQYQCWIDQNTLRPIRTTSRIREGGYQYRSSFDYIWANNTVKTFGQNIKNGNTYNKTLRVAPCSYDAVALFYNLRSVDISNMKNGVPYKLNLVLEDTVRTINYKFLGREEISIDGVGKFKTIKISCQIATKTDDALKDGSEFFIWLTDDKNRIPIYMESPIRVGSIKVYITNWKGLKHPLTSFRAN